MIKLITYIQVISIIIFAACFITGAFLDGKFYYHRPSHPVIATGNIYKTFVHHGAVVYLTKQEKSLLDEMQPVSTVCFFIAFIISLPKIIELKYSAGLKTPASKKRVVMFNFLGALTTILLVVLILNIYSIPINSKDLFEISIFPITCATLTYFTYGKKKLSDK